MLKDYIINFFILSDHNSLLNIYEYIKRRYYKTIDINNIKNEIESRLGDYIPNVELILENVYDENGELMSDFDL